MKIALIGYGAMGKLIKTLAENKNHEVAVIIDESSANLSIGELSEKLKGVDAAIDFSVAEAVRRNVEACCLAQIPLVEGTTGWNAELENVKNLVEEKNGAFVFGANFSIGVNLFYLIANFAAELFSRFEDYEAFVETFFQIIQGLFFFAQTSVNQRKIKRQNMMLFRLPV